MQQCDLQSSQKGMYYNVGTAKLLMVKKSIVLGLIVLKQFVTSETSLLKKKHLFVIESKFFLFTALIKTCFFFKGDKTAAQEKTEANELEEIQ